MKKNVKTILSQGLTVKNNIDRLFKSHPVTIGVPWPKGKLKNAESVRVIDDGKRELPSATTVLNNWDDGSVQWTLLDLSVDLKPSDLTCLKVVADGKKESRQELYEVSCGVRVNQTGNSIECSNGIVEIKVSEDRNELIESLKVNGREILKNKSLDVIIKSSDGRTYSAKASQKKLSIEHSNAIRTVVRIDGKHTDENGNTLLEFWLKITMCINSKDVNFTYNFRNKEEQEPGITLKEMYMQAEFDVGDKPEHCITHVNRTRWYSTELFSTKSDFDIVVSDVDDVEHYPEKHKQLGSPMCFVRQGEVLEDPPENKPWFLRDVKFRRHAGDRVVFPYIGFRGKEHSVFVMMKKMDALYPKSLSAESGKVKISFWPDWAGDLLVTQGAGRTMNFVISGLKANAGDEEFLDNYLSYEGLYKHILHNFEIIPDYKWIRKCKVFYVDKLPAYEPEKHFRFERKIAHAWFEGGARRGNICAPPPAPTGMWHYGDNLIMPGAYTSNNEEMNGNIYLQDFLRTGRWENAEVGLTRAQHIIDVDYCAYSREPYQNQGMVAHCTNHNNGAVYPSHQWFTELFIAYAITGNPEFKQTGLDICENLLFWINDEKGFTKSICSDQRESGQPLINLTWAYQWNRDKRYIDACMKIARGKYFNAEKKYGKIIDVKPNKKLHILLIQYCDHAGYEGMFYLWDLTRDKQIGDFLVRQYEWRVRDDMMGTTGGFRATDINPTAYAYYMTGDKKYFKRVEKTIKALFSASNWQIGWIKSMYALKIAFDLGMIKDSDVTL